MPEIPRFEGYFKSQAAGKHPFEEENFSQSPPLGNTAEEEAFDEELLEREL